jgi:DNA-binding response OmpR family regulator
MNMRIAVVDDEQDIAELAALHLRKENFSVQEYYDAASFMASLRDAMPQAIILDLMLPDADGYEICRALKADGNYAHIPVIMLTAKGEEADKVRGLELGADDYVTKPFSPRELVARVKAVLRRNLVAQETGNIVRPGDAVVVGGNTYQITVEGKPIDAASEQVVDDVCACAAAGCTETPHDRAKVIQRMRISNIQQGISNDEVLRRYFALGY